MKKGFTLIELLAVVVILGVVALISAPIVGDVIRKSQKGAFEDSVYGLIKAVNLVKADEGFNINRTYTVTNGIISPTLQTEGSVNGTGVIELDEDGNIYVRLQYDEWCAIKEKETKVVKVTEETCVVNSDPANANTPFLYKNMIPVRWDGSKWIKADRRNPASNQWYSYGTTLATRKWANAVVVKAVGTKTRDYYLSDAAIGVEVAATDILGHFVWIPRFSYAIPTGSGARSINILFEQGVEDKNTGTAIGTSYLTHPAFTFSDKELAGFWISKFEANGIIDNITFIPGAQAVVSQPIISVYEKVSQMTFLNNPYGFTTAQTNVHLTKNDQWGAVSYLTNSVYGKNAIVWKNPSTTFVSGCAGTTAVPAGSAGCANIYSTANGQQASTTGNVYGVYDMSGGAYDLVMANYNERPGTSGLSMFPDSRYFNKFTSLDAATACNSNVCYGQALSETSAWYTGTTTFVDAFNPWMIRGNASNVAAGSIYSFDAYRGEATANITFRLTLSNK